MKFLSSFVSILLVTLVTGYQPTGKYDLGPDDLDNLCNVVGPSSRGSQGGDCIYMKWEFCPGTDEKDPKPCGFFKQAKCERRKRGLRTGPNEENNEQSLLTTTYLTWPSEFKR